MKGQSSKFVKSAATALRNAPTDAERKLWRRLRGDQLGYKFRRQHPYENHVLDFVCLELQLVVEVDGSQHMERRERDAVRTACLNAAGFRVLRFWNDEVLKETDAVVEAIWREVKSLGPSPP